MFGRSDLPLNRDAAARYLPWINGFMTYLCVNAVAAALTVDRVAERWREGLAGNLTVERPFPAELETERRAEQLDAAMEFITGTPGVTGATVLEDSQVAALLEPWLGPDASQLDVPLPVMVAVTRVSLAEVGEIKAAVRIEHQVVRRRKLIAIALGIQRRVRLGLRVDALNGAEFVVRVRPLPHRRPFDVTAAAVVA